MNTETAPSLAPSLALQLGSTALALVLVLALAWLALRTLKKFQNRSQRSSGGNPVQVLRSIGLGPRERLVTVRYRDREYLLGVATGGVNLIDSWPEGAAPAGATAPVAAALP